MRIPVLKTRNVQHPDDEEKTITVNKGIILTEYLNSTNHTYDVIFCLDDIDTNIEDLKESYEYHKIPVHTILVPYQDKWDHSVLLESDDFGCPEELFDGLDISYDSPNSQDLDSDTEVYIL